MDASKINQHALDALSMSLFNSCFTASDRRNSYIATALKALQAKNQKRLDDRRKEKACSNPTCADCSSQDKSKAAIASIGVTYCLKKSTHVILGGDTCDDFIAKPKTLQEKPKNLAETVTDLYAKNADLTTQKDALKSANEELRELVNDCPACKTHSQVIDGLESILDKRDARNHESEKAITELIKQVEGLIARNSCLESIVEKRDILCSELNRNNNYFEQLTDKQETCILEYEEEIDELSNELEEAKSSRSMIAKLYSNILKERDQSKGK